MAKPKRSKGKDRKEYRMCARKRKFKSSEASRASSMLGQRKYRCPYCGHWHLTKKKKGY